MTAQRREQSLQDVPIAVTALTSSTINTIGGGGALARIEIATPGLSITTQRANITPYLRGVGTQNAAGGEEGAVPIYVDGILVTSLLGAAMSLPNVQRVEVLKGPQGTLFGRNALGGLINVITKQPSHIPLVEGSVSYGNYETVTATAYATAGVTDNIAADLSLYFTDQARGWGENFTLGTEANKKKEWALRSKVLFTPTTDLRITIAADYSDRNSDTGPTRGVLPGSIAFRGLQPKGGIYDTQSNRLGKQSFEQWGVSGRVEYDLGFASLTSTTAYRKYDGGLYYDQDASPLVVVEVPTVEAGNSLQQELLLTGRVGDLRYTTGLFYLDADAQFDYSLQSEFLPTNNVYAFGLQRTKAYSGFIQGEFEFVEGTTLTGGVRYTDEKRTMTAQQFAGPGFPFAPPGTLLATRDPKRDANANISVGKFTWRVGLDHHLNDDVLLYASFSTGFKSGVFNASDPFQRAVRPETLDAYEIGFKADLFDRKARFNASTFHYNYKNIQLVRAVAGPPQILNATSGEINGIDAELVYYAPIPVGKLSFTGAVNYLDAKYGDYPGGPMTIPQASGGNIQTVGDLTGRDMLRSPKVTLSLTGSFALPTSAGEASFTLSYYYNDGFAWEPDNRLKQSSYNLVNATLMLTSSNETWGLGLFCNNCSDTKYYSWVSANGLGDLGSPAPPRTYGATLKFKFGG
nr:B360 [uncultured bacterium]